MYIKKISNVSIGCNVSSNKRMWLAFTFVFLSIFAAGPAFAQEDNYRLGTQDKVRLRVFEWRAPIDKFFEWEALNGEFLVGQAGNISVPLIGEIPAAGLTTSELAETIGQQMIQQIGLSFPPKVAVEVSEYRPFYIVGAVTTPGAYPYQPGLTVLRALSIAGGLPRPVDMRFNRIGREVISGRGAVTQLAHKINELLARKARLTAELNGAEEVVYPEVLTELKDRNVIARILEQEQRIFTTRRDALDRQIRTLDRLKNFLAEEIKSLGEQVELKKGELASVNQELKNVQTLVKKGLAPANRQFSLERIVSQLSSERLQLETTLLRARQEISRTDVDIEAAKNRNAMEATTQLREADTELEEAMVQIKMQEQLLYDSEVVFPGLLSSQHKNAAANTTRYIIVRDIDGKQQEITANETTKVLPGDAIKVEIPMPDAAGLRASATGATQ